MIKLKPKQYIKAIIIFLLCILFLEMLERIVENQIVKFDEFIYNLFYRNDTMTSIMKVITFLGEASTLIGLCIISLIGIKDKKIAWTIPLNLILITILTQSLKFIVKRPRPTGINLIDIGGYSFPSGHTTSSVAFYGYLIYLIYKKCQNRKTKSCLITILSILIFLIGISRIYLGVHYASDVLAGFALSTAYLIIYTIFISKKIIIEN